MYSKASRSTTDDELSDLHMHTDLTSSSSCARTAGPATDARVIGTRARAPHSEEDAYRSKGRRIRVCRLVMQIVGTEHGPHLVPPIRADTNNQGRSTSTTQAYAYLDCYLFVQSARQCLCRLPTSARDVDASRRQPRSLSRPMTKIPSRLEQTKSAQKRTNAGASSASYRNVVEGRLGLQQHILDWL